MIMGVSFLGVEAGEVATFFAEVVETLAEELFDPEGFLFLELFSSLFEMGDILES